MSRDIWEAGSSGDMMLFTYSCPKTYHCTPLSSFTDCQSSGKRAISNHVSLHLHPQISHSSFTKRRMPVWTPGKEFHYIARTTKPHETSPLLPLLWEITFSFHVCLACGMRCQQPAAQLLLPRHINVQRHSEISAHGASLQYGIPPSVHARTPNFAFLPDVNQQNIRHDRKDFSLLLFTRNGSSKVSLKYPLNLILIPSFVRSISP